jgi:hypothetical protein
VRAIRPLWHRRQLERALPRRAFRAAADFGHDASVREPIEPRIWLGLSVAALLASVVPYWFWLGRSSLLLNAVLALAAAAALWANIKGERRLALEAIRKEEAQRRAIEGAPNSTSGSGTATEPSSRW